MEEALQNIINTVVHFALTAGGKLIAALLIIIIGFRIVKALSRRIQGSKGFQKLEKTAQNIVLLLLQYGLKLIVLLTAVTLIGIPMTTVIALVTSAGLTVGLALQGSLSNIAGGFLIFFFHLFKVNDFITTNDVSGTVVQIDLFYTTIHTPDNQRIVVPNSNITNATLVDLSSLPTRRISLSFSVSYDADSDLVRRVLLEQAKENDAVLSDPAPVVYMTQHADSAVVFELRVWCKNADYWNVKFALTENVKRAFDQSGISIPYPQLDVHMK